MDEITYRRKLGFALTSFFMVDILGIIVFTVIPYFVNMSGMSVERGTLMNVAVGIVINLMATVLLGYMVTRPGLCPNLMARISGALMLLIVVFNLVIKINVASGGSYWFANTYWYDTVVSLFCFLAMSGFLFSQRIWLANKVLGSLAYFLNVVLDFTYYCVIDEYLEYGKNYFNAYSSIVIVFDVVWIVLYLISIILLMIWAFRKPRVTR